MGQTGSIILLIVVSAFSRINTFNQSVKIASPESLTVEYTPTGTIDSVLGFTTGDKTVRAGVVSVDSVSYADTAGYATYSDSAGYLFVGKVWEAQTTPDTTIWSIVYGNGMFVAGTPYPLVITSRDGINWIVRSAPAATSTMFNGCYGNGMFSFVGYDGVDNIISSDGVTWEGIDMPSADYLGIAYGNNIFIAVGDGISAYSQNGRDWTSGGTIPSNNYVHIAYGDSLFVAVASDGVGNRIVTTTDGTTWTARTASNLAYYKVIFGKGLFLAIANSGDSVATSPNGVDWTTRQAISGTWRGAEYYNGLFVVVGNSGAIMTSPDCITWTSRTAPNSNHYNCITSGNGMLVAASFTGSTDRIMTSGSPEYSVPPPNNIYQGGMEINGDVLLPDLEPSQVVVTNSDTVLSTSSLKLLSASSDTGRLLVLCDDSLVATDVHMQNSGCYMQSGFEMYGRAYNLYGAPYIKLIDTALTLHGNHDENLIKFINTRSYLAKGGAWNPINYGMTLRYRRTNYSPETLNDSMACRFEIVSNGPDPDITGEIIHLSINDSTAQVSINDTTIGSTSRTFSDLWIRNESIKISALSPGKVVTTGTDTVLTTPDSAGIPFFSTDTLAIGGGSEIIKMEITDGTNDTLEITIGAKTWQFLPIADQ